MQKTTDSILKNQGFLYCVSAAMFPTNISKVGKFQEEVAVSANERFLTQRQRYQPVTLPQDFSDSVFLLAAFPVNHRTAVPRRRAVHSTVELNYFPNYKVRPHLMKSLIAPWPLKSLNKPKIN